MKNLQEATERICELKGSLVALDALVTALLQAMPVSARAGLQRTIEGHAEVARTVLLNTSRCGVWLRTDEQPGGVRCRGPRAHGISDPAGPGCGLP